MVSPQKTKEKSPEDLIEVVVPDEKVAKKCCKTKAQIPNKKVNLVVAKASKITREAHRQKLIQRQKSRQFLFVLLLCLSAIIAALIVSHYKFIKNVEKELVSIQKMYLGAGYRNEGTYSFTILEDESIDTAAIRSEVERGLEKLNGETSSVEVPTLDTTSGPIVSSTDTTDNVNVDNEQELMIASVYETIGNQKQEHDRSSNPIISSDEEGEMANEDWEIHYKKHEKIMKHLKIDVMYKIYAYVSVFFIFVIFLLALDFFVIARMLFREKNLLTIFC